MKTRLLSAMCAFLAVFASNTYATAVGFSINTSVTQGGTLADFPATDFALPVVGASIRLDPGTLGSFLEVDIPGGSTFVGAFSVIDGATGSSDSFLELFSQGETVGDATFNAPPGIQGWGYALYNNVPGPDWVASFTDKYIGFRTGAGNYGYVNVNWIYNSSTGIGTLDFLNGAVETVAGTGISIIPIPPAVWLFGSGLLGLVGIARRKKAA